MKVFAVKIGRFVLLVWLLLLSGLALSVGSYTITWLLISLGLYGYHDTIVYVTLRFPLLLLVGAALVGICWRLISRYLMRENYWIWILFWIGLVLIFAFAAIYHEYLHWRWLQGIPPQFR